MNRKTNPALTRLLAAETALFRKDYDKHFSENESKPRSIGMPYFLPSSLSDTGVLLIHGLMAAPEEVREWAEFLNNKGFTVYAPRLSGHGTSYKDLATRRYEDWIDSVDRGHAVLKACCKKVLVAGFSTGAGIALQTAIIKPRDFEAVIAVSAPYKFKSFSSNFAELLNGFNRACHFLGMPQYSREFVVNHADNPHINYLRCPVSAFVQVKKLMKKVKKSLQSLKIPALVIQANNDPKVSPESGPAIFELIGAESKKFSWIDHNIHGIVRGKISLEVFKNVEDFLLDHSLMPTNQ